MRNPGQGGWTGRQLQERGDWQSTASGQMLSQDGTMAGKSGKLDRFIMIYNFRVQHSFPKILEIFYFFILDLGPVLCCADNP